MKTKTLLLVASFLITVQINLLGQTIVKEITNHALGRSAFADAISLQDPTLRDGILAAYDFKDSTAVAIFNRTYSVKLPLFRNMNAIGTKSAPVVQGAGGIAVLSNPTLGVDALGTFIANRFKQEINVAFLDKFKSDVLDTTKLPGSILGRLLPRTKMVLATVDPYNYPVYLETLNQALDDDIHKLMVTIPKIPPLLNPKTRVLHETHAVILASLLDINSRLDLIASINKIANSLPEQADGDLKNPCYAFAIAINAINGGGVGEKMFLTTDDINALSDPTTLNYFVGLLIRQNQFYITQIFTEKQIKDSLNFKGLVENLVPIYSAMAKQANSIANLATQDKLTPTIIQQSLNLLVKSLQSTVFVLGAHFPNLKLTSFSAALTKAGLLSDITRLIVEKKYGVALLQTVSFLDGNFETKLNSEQKAVLLRYLNFTANVLSAETKDDLVQALEIAANPVGSYRVKRNSTFNVSFNAYAGGFAASEKTYGFTAPVGIYFGWGNLGKDTKNVFFSDSGKSFGIFLPLLDVGAVTAFRLKDSGTELADVSWENVFSPGAYASFGFGKCPISLNLGGQLGPELKSVDSAGQTTLTDKEWLWRVSVVVDIPVFDFYIRQRAYKLPKQKSK